MENEKNKSYDDTKPTDIVKNIDFPVSKQDLISRYGNKSIKWSSEETLTLKELVETADSDCFNSPDELTEILTP